MSDLSFLEVSSKRSVRERKSDKFISTIYFTKEDKEMVEKVLNLKDFKSIKVHVYRDLRVRVTVNDVIVKDPVTKGKIISFALGQLHG